MSTVLQRDIVPDTVHNPVDDNMAASQPSENRINPTFGDAPGATGGTAEKKTLQSLQANEQAESTGEQKVVESSEQQVKDPRAPKIKFGPLSMLTVIGPEWLPIIPAAVSSGVSGVAPLLFFEVLGGLFGSFASASSSELASDTATAALYIFIIALVAAVLQLFSHFVFNLCAQRIGNRIKNRYFISLTTQEIGFFDIKKAGALANTMSDDIAKVTDAFSVNLQDICQYGTMFVVAVILALVANYAMALLQMIAIPIILIILGIMGRCLDLLGRKQGRLMGESIATANEVISSMRTVRSMAGEKREAIRYANDLDKIRWIYLTTSTLKGIAFAIVIFCVWGCVALAFYFGGQLIGWSVLGVAGFIKVYGLVLMAIIALMNIFNVLPEVIKAVSSSALILQVIKREPAIRFKGGKTLDTVQGLIEFKDVTFTYPSRPNVQVLKNFNLRIEPGQSFALVGQSGSGKSTLVGLIEKWYEPDSGTITIDGVDIHELDPQWLHRYVGIVQQEPTLFATSIKRNITYAVDTINGLITRDNKNLPKEELQKLLVPVTDEIIIKAAQAANCHDFIMTLPDKYDTVIGERGVSMSGGQKQRVAIARAVLQDPKILLLDEATSALDTKSEALVQDALEKLMVGRTSIVIAHRLTTIQDCDRIIVMREGLVVEEGKHDELLDKRGAYYNLAKKQMMLNESDSSTDLASSSGGESDTESSDGDSRPDLQQLEQQQQNIPMDHNTNAELSTMDENPSTMLDDDRNVALDEQRKNSGTQDDHPQHWYKHKKQSKRQLRKKRRKELEEFTNEEDIVDINEPKVRTGFGILPYIGRETLLILLGAFGAAVVGAVPIGFYLVFGRVVNGIIPGRDANGGIIPFPAGYSIPAYVAQNAGWLAIVAAGGFVGQFINMFFFTLASERVGIRFKKAYFRSVIKQELGFFDIKKSGKILSVLSEDIDGVQAGFTSRFAVFVQNMSQCVLGIILALVTSWQVALLAMAAILFLICFVAIISLLTGLTNRKIGHLSGSTLATATEVIGSIRTVRSMAGEEREQNRLNNDLKLISRIAVVKATLRGIMQCTIQFIILGDAAFVFWYGGQEVARGAINAGQLIQVFGFVLFAVLGLSLALSELPNFVKARNGALEMLRVIERKPLIPISGGKKLDKIDGNVQFENISFSYPTRPNVVVLKNFSLTIRSGQHVALVGESGCGKSTITGLVERFYDPQQGRVIIDGLDLKEADPEWLHQNVGIVTQEPVLFATTIKNNILYSVGDRAKEIPMERIIECAKAANCHGFIEKLPNGYDTMIGERGVSMSGGQKQRIAIARAMLQNSSLLILDEATSALDTESEALVQEALDRLMHGRTSVVIAHRLSTVQDCDLIVAMKAGKVMETGTHDELIKKRGMYYKLAQKQMQFGMTNEQKEQQGIEEVQITEND